MNQMSGIHLQMAQFIPIIPFKTTKQYEDYLARLKQVPRVFDADHGGVRGWARGEDDAAQVSAGEGAGTGTQDQCAGGRGERVCDAAEELSGGACRRRIRSGCGQRL